jgi:Domain of unknown function (DUF4288)
MEGRSDMWFGVSLLYRSSEPLDEQGTQLFEERIIVLDAADEGEAWKKAKERGPSKEAILALFPLIYH